LCERLCEDFERKNIEVNSVFRLAIVKVSRIRDFSVFITPDSTPSKLSCVFIKIKNFTLMAKIDRLSLVCPIVIIEKNERKKMLFDMENFQRPLIG
jgi:hypothetical protein